MIGADHAVRDLSITHGEPFPRVDWRDDIAVSANVIANHP
jgi:hypothetical protein